MLHGENVYVVSGKSMLKRKMTSYVILIIVYLKIYYLKNGALNLFPINSICLLHSRIDLYSLLYNGDTTLGENIKYFMNKYKISYKGWYSPFYFIILINTLIICYK